MGKQYFFSWTFFRWSMGTQEAIGFLCRTSLDQTACSKSFEINNTVLFEFFVRYHYFSRRNNCLQLLKPRDPEL